MQQTNKVNRMRAVKFVVFAEGIQGTHAQPNAGETVKEMDRRNKEGYRERDRKGTMRRQRSEGRARNKRRETVRSLFTQRLATR
jgi:hypothetical protein